jgi:hypothetical protein
MVPFRSDLMVIASLFMLESPQAVIVVKRIAQIILRMIPPGGYRANYCFH